MVPLGSGTGVTTYSVSAGGAYSFVNYNGSQWYMVGTNGADHMVDYSSVALSAWGAASANVAMGSNKITGLANGTVSTDGAAFGQIPLLTDSVSSTSITTAATPNSVKTAYDLAVTKGLPNTAQTAYSTTAASLVSTLALAVQMGAQVTISGFTTYLVTFTNTAVGTGTGTANAAINYGFQYVSGTSVISGGGYQTVGQLITTANTRGTYSYNTVLVMNNTGTAIMAMGGYLGGTGNTLSVSNHQISVVGIA